MSDQITSELTDSGFIVRVDGRGSSAGFLSIMLAAKFSDTPVFERTISPFVNDIIRTALSASSRKPEDVDDIVRRSKGDEYWRSLYRLVDEEWEIQKEFGLYNSIDEMRFAAFFPLAAHV